MTTDGFSTLTAGLMERGTDRVRALLGSEAVLPKAAKQPQPILDGPANGESAKPDNTQPEKSKAAPKKRAKGDVKQPAPALPETNDATEKEPDQTSRRGAAGSTLMIAQPPTGDMSEVTVSLVGAKPEQTDKPSKHGQRPTSVTYERCTVEEHGHREAEGEEARRLWIDTPTFSGPDRRHKKISPEVERRKSVPPRLKVGVRLEQERYLRLKLASQDTDRTQQDLITSALDFYFDQIGIDRFVRIAMGFGGATPTVGPASEEGSEAAGDAELDTGES